MKGELAIFLVKFGWNYGGEILTSGNGWSLFVRSLRCIYAFSRKELSVMMRTDSPY